MNDQKGLYGKYDITKDGNPLDGPAFVLRPDRDEAAYIALAAYAVLTTNRRLKKDLADLLIEIKEQQDGGRYATLKAAEHLSGVLSVLTALLGNPEARE